MSEFSWDTVDVDETITETEQKKSDNLDIQTPVGKMLCTIVECEPIEKDFNAYSCMAAKLKMRVDGLIQLEQPIIDSNGQVVIREGQPIAKVQDIPANKKVEFEALLLGQFVFDEISLYHPKEKEATKRRRLFVAKRLGLISPTATSIGAREWSMAPGKQVIVTTEWNTWKDKNSGELKRNVKVAWAGYDFVNSDPVDMSHNDFSNI